MRTGIHCRRIPVLLLVVVCITAGMDVLAGDGGFTVLSFNVGDKGPPRPTTEQIHAATRSFETADLMVVQDRPWTVRLDDMARQRGYEYFVSGRDQPHRTNLGIMSKVPLSNVDSIGFGGSVLRRGALCADAAFAQKTLRICSVHLPSLSQVVKRSEKTGSFGEMLPTLFAEIFRETDRSRSVTKLLDWLARYQGKTLVVAGDFNTFPVSTAIRRMRKKFLDAFRHADEFSQGTYVGLKLPVKPRIDFIFHTPDLTPVRTDVWEQTAGDHYPVFAEFGWQ